MCIRDRYQCHRYLWKSSYTLFWYRIMVTQWDGISFKICNDSLLEISRWKNYVKNRLIRLILFPRKEMDNCGRRKEIKLLQIQFCWSIKKVWIKSRTEVMPLLMFLRVLFTFHKPTGPTVHLPQTIGDQLHDIDHDFVRDSRMTDLKLIELFTRHTNCFSILNGSHSCRMWNRLKEWHLTE